MEKYLADLLNLPIHHKSDFILLTVVECFIFAFIILIPVRKKHFSGVKLWAYPFGLTFLILGLMYLVRLIQSKTGFPDKTLTDISDSILSGFSNSFLYITTIIIKGNFEQEHFLDKTLFESLFSGRRRWMFALIIIGSLTSIIAGMSGNESLALPDHLASGIVLFYFGYVIFFELAFRHSRGFAWIALSYACAYAAIYAYILYTLITGWIVFGLPVSTGLDEDTSAMNIAITFFLKAGLFFPTYFLITLISNEFQGIRELLKATAVSKKIEFLASEGILKKMCETLEAEKVKLFIRLPGQKQKLVSVYQYPMTKEVTNDPQKKPEIIRNEKSEPKIKVYKQVFKKAELVTYNVRNYPNNVDANLESEIDKNLSLIAVPIKYHGAVIGCLETRLRIRQERGFLLNKQFSNTDVLLIQRIAVLLTRVVQANREVAGIDQLITALGSLQTDLRALRADDAIEKILETLYHLFNPLALGIITDIGFKVHYQTYPAKDRLLEDKLKERSPQQEDDFSGIHSYIKNDLIVPSKKEKVKNEERIFGQLIAVVSSQNDKPDSPTLFTYHLFCRVVSNIIADAYLDFGRDYFNHHLKELSVRLNAPENSSVSAWFKTVEEKAVEVGLLWAAVSGNDSFNEINDKNREYLEELQKTRQPDYQREKEPTGLYHFQRETIGGANHIIRLELEKVEGYLWLGVKRAGFGSEIEKYATSPWKTFLERLAEISDTALNKTLERDKREQYAKEAAEFHGLATAAVTVGTLLHQIGNQVKEITFPVDLLKNTLYVGELRGTKESWQRIFDLRESATKLSDLTKLLSGVVKVDTTSPCRLGDIIEESKKLFEGALNQYNITFDNELPPELEDIKIEIPFYVGSFAIVNLVINAKDAIKNAHISSGVIRIEAEEIDGCVLFHVTDNGPGVPKELGDKIFEKGVTTKIDGTGLGLYFTDHSLKENGSVVKLTDFGPEPPTRFTIRFPKFEKGVN